jgi:hypothetical protein
MMHRQCAGRGCLNPGVYSLEVRYIGKNGWFCAECREGLIAAGLVVEDTRRFS